MNTTVLGSCLVGGLLGGVVGHMISRRASTQISSELPQQKTEIIDQQEMEDDEELAIAQAIPHEITDNLNKMNSLSSSAGKKIVSAIVDLCRQIAVACSLVSAETQSDDVPNPELKKIVHSTCTKLSNARLLLDKLYTIERARAGMLEEFVIYKTTVQSELDGFGSCLNNYLTKNMLNS